MITLKNLTADTIDDIIDALIDTCNIIVSGFDMLIETSDERTTRDIINQILEVE